MADPETTPTESQNLTSPQYEPVTQEQMQKQAEEMPPQHHPEIYEDSPGQAAPEQPADPNQPVPPPAEPAA